MRPVIRLLILICCVQTGYSQGFTFTKNQRRVAIPFKLINNLIIVPIVVNGVPLNFLLDSGVEETILFSLENKEEIRFYNVEKIMLRGLGSQDAVEGLKSTKNTLTLPGLRLTDQVMLIVLDESMNFSSSLGMPVNGIVGFNFFKDNMIEINYAKRKLFIYNPAKTTLAKRTRKFTPLAFSLEQNKPYIAAKVTITDEETIAKLLLDTGNSDAVWLFHNQSDKVWVPEKNFDDFLGRGFSGEIYGRKARISKFSMGGFTFKNPIVSFPDTISFRNVRLVPDRLGSVGGEVFKRFVLILDYRSSMAYLKKTGNFDLPFHYNMSGIELHHAGLRLVQEQQKNKSADGSVRINYGEQQYDIRYKFELKPVYEIGSVRQGSPAQKIGLQKGDVILTIDNNASYRYSLQEINQIFRSSPGRIINLEIERGGIKLKFRLKLENLI